MSRAFKMHVTNDAQPNFEPRQFEVVPDVYFSGEQDVKEFI